MESQDVSWRFHPRQVYREVKSFQVICFHHLESEFHNGKPQGQHRLSGEKVVVQCGDAIGREISAGHDHGAASTQLHREVQRRCMTTQMNSMAWHSQRTSIGACNWNRGQAPCTIESRRLAVDVLVEKGRGAFHEFLAHEGVPSFLNSREGRYIRHNLVHPARRPSYEPDGYGGSGSDWDGGNGDGSSVSGTYWPVFSDVAAPELDLGWPMSWGRQGSCTGRSCGSSGAATYFHPPSTDGSPSIKQVVHRLIEGARTVLAIATDVFTDIDVFQDVLNASIYRRIPVYILLDSLNAPLFEEMCRKLNVPFHQLDNLRVRTIAGVPFHCKSGIKFLGQMFEKFLLVDCHTVLCGTYSFTWSFEKIHRSVAHVFTGTAASDFDEEFRLLYAQSQTLCPGQSPPSVMAQAHYNFPERASMQPYKTAQASQQVPVVCFQSPNYLHAIPPYLAAEESFESSSGSSRKAIWKGPWGEKPSRFPAAHFTHEDAFEKTKNNRIGFQWHNPANWRSGGDWPTEQETWQGSGRKGNDSNTRQPAGERKTLQGQLQWGWEYVGKPGLQINSKDQNRFESPYFALAHRTQFEDTASPKVAPGGFRPLCLNTAKIAQAQPRNEALPAEVWGQKNIDMQWNSVHTQNTNGLPETQLLPTWLTYETNREWPKGRPRTAEGNLRPRPRGNDDFDTNAQERNLHRASRLRPSLIYHSLPRLPARSRFTGKHHIDVKGKVSAMQEIPHENDREETIAARLNNQPVENKTPIYNRGAVLGYARNYQLTSRQKTVGIHETSLSSHVQLNQKMRNDDRAVSKVYSNNFISNEKLQKQSRIDKPTTRIEAVASEEKVNSSEQQWEGKFPGTENDEYQERVMENEDKHDDTTVGKPASLGASLIVLLQRSNLKDDTKALLKDMSAKGQQQAASATIEEEKVNERQVCINRGGERAKESREMAEVGEPKAENLVQKAEVMRRDNRVFSRFEVLMNPDGEKEDRRETSISKQEASEVEDSNKDVGKSTDDKKKSPDTRYINTTSGQRALVRDKQSTRDLNNREEKSRVIEAVDDIPGRRCKVKISPGRRHPERCRPGYGLAAQSRSSLLENYWKR